MSMSLLHSITAIPAPFNMVVWIVLICSVAGVITGVAKQTRKYFCHREEIELKREMFESGMSADEIERDNSRRSRGSE